MKFTPGSYAVNQHNVQTVLFDLWKAMCNLTLVEWRQPLPVIRHPLPVGRNLEPGQVTDWWIPSLSKSKLEHSRPGPVGAIMWLISWLWHRSSKERYTTHTCRRDFRILRLAVYSMCTIRKSVVATSPGLLLAACMNRRRTPQWMKDSCFAKISIRGAISRQRNDIYWDHNAEFQRLHEDRNVLTLPFKSS